MKAYSARKALLVLVSAAAFKLVQKKTKEISVHIDFELAIFDILCLLRFSCQISST